MRVVLQRFPPGKSGGLIEAQRLPLHSSRWAGCFRRVNPAASLKHDSRRSEPGFPDLVVFPPGKSGGLIEAPYLSRPSLIPPRVSAG